jgi:hypothetical protein
MTGPQQKLACYILGTSGNCYIATDHTKRCLIGMLQTGEITESDFGAVSHGGPWLGMLKQYASKMGRGYQWK